MARYVCFGFGMAALLGACDSVSSVNADVPPEVRWLAAAAMDPKTSEVSGSTLLQPAGGDLALAYPTSHDVWILGFESDVIDRLRAVVEARGSEFEQLRKAARLASPDPCLERLPAPSWGRFIDPSGATREVPSDEVPPFRAPWLSGVCASLPLAPNPDSDILSALSLEVNGQFCARDALRQLDCGLEFRWDRCGIGGLPPLELRLEWDDRVCMAGRSECVPAPGEEAAPRAVGFRCEGNATELTELRIHRPRWSEGEAFVRTEHVRVIDVDLPISMIVDWVSPDVLNRNHVSAMLELGTQVVATVHPEEKAGRTCVGPPSTRLVFVDQESLEVVRTATAPPCLTRLAPHPNGGFVGAFQRLQSSFEVARFDEVGRVVATTHLMDTPKPGLNLWISALNYLPSIDRYLVFVAPSERGAVEIDHADNHALLLDRDLRVVSRAVLPLINGRVAISLVRLVSTPDGPRLLLGEDADGRYLLTDLDVSEIEKQTAVPKSVGISRRIQDVLLLADERLLLSAGGDSPVLAEVFPAPGSSVRYEAYQFEALAEASVLAPLGPDMVLAVVTPKNGTGEAVYLSRFDTRRFRFVAGSPRLRMPDGSDPGAATRSLVDSKGRIWLGFAKSPYLTRLEPIESD